MVERLVGVLLQRGTKDRIVDDSNAYWRNSRQIGEISGRAVRDGDDCVGVRHAPQHRAVHQAFSQRLVAFHVLRDGLMNGGDCPRSRPCNLGGGDGHDIGMIAGGHHHGGPLAAEKTNHGGNGVAHVPYAQLTDPHRRRKGFEVGRFSKRSDQQDDVESTIRERAGQVGEDAFRACGPEVGDEEDDLPIHGVHGFPVARGFRRRRPFGDDITERLFATLLHAGFSGRLPSAEAVVAIGRLHNGP